MPIKWSAMKVHEKANEIEAVVKELMKPLEKIQKLTEEGMEIPSIPQYIEQRFQTIKSESERHLVTKWDPEGMFTRLLNALRKDIPEDALKREQANSLNGNQQGLI